MQRFNDIPEAKAKTILIALCSDDSALAARASRFLAHIESLERRMTAGDHQKGTKRKAKSAIKICIQCQEPFYEEDNSDKACRYHDGELEVDHSSDFWADHDEDCHGEIDTVENRVEFPEGFIWNCCNKMGHRSGCTRGRHNALSGQRGRYGDKPGTVFADDQESSTENEQGSQEEESESEGEDEDGC
ncbi:hypothetical protein F5Y19DRAFT_433302 [Xylariaceae sp. FL1651]|nr:hypothetical protein F5Y19DRAFT_433302 [Xylariaceae sp. FL1651]